MTHKAYSDKAKAKAKELFCVEGKSLRQIERQLGIGYQALLNWRKKGFWELDRASNTQHARATPLKLPQNAKTDETLAFALLDQKSDLKSLSDAIDGHAKTIAITSRINQEYLAKLFKAFLSSETGPSAKLSNQLKQSIQVLETCQNISIKGFESLSKALGIGKDGASEATQQLESVIQDRIKKEAKRAEEAIEQALEAREQEQETDNQDQGYLI